MTIYTQFTNLNMDYLSNGMNTQTSWFTPAFSFTGWTMPSFNFNSIFPSFFNSASFMPSFNFDFSKLFPTDIWSNNTNNTGWNFNWNNTNTTSIWNNNSSYKFSSAFPSGDTFTLTNKNKKGFSVSNYDADAGERLAKTALSNSKGFSGYCATYVKRAIEKSGLGSYEQGDAYEMSNILRKNKNFKEISPSKVNVEDLPAGCVIVYNKGVQGYSPEYGHTEITTGDGRAVSDGITQNLHKTPSAIFVPVTA